MGSFAYYDREADIVWIPVAKPESGGVINDVTAWGLIDRDEISDQVTGVEIWGHLDLFPPTFWRQCRSRHQPTSYRR